MKRLGWMCGSIVLVWTLYLVHAGIWFRLYPVFAVALVWSMFARSLFRTPLVEVFAGRLGATLDVSTKCYCRNVTRLWVAFLGVHFFATLATVWAPLAVWAFYNGFLSYALIGALLGGEWLYRHYRLKRAVHSDVVRHA